MIDLDWIISTENELTDKAKLKLGDNYMLSIDLLNLLCSSIESFSKNNEVAHCFETQIVKDFHLIVLNIIRRHTTIANILIRHAIESIVLFTYSMVEHTEEKFNVIRDPIGIVSFNNKILNKANSYFKKTFREESKNLEEYKESINHYYSHSNIFSAQFNTAIIEERVKLLIFDNYFDDYIRNSLLICNDIMCITLGLYLKLHDKYRNFILYKSFNEDYDKYLKRHIKNIRDNLKNEDSLNQDLPDTEKIIQKINKKYNEGR